MGVTSWSQVRLSRCGGWSTPRRERRPLSQLWTRNPDLAESQHIAHRAIALEHIDDVARQSAAVGPHH